MIEAIVVATTNPHKLAEIREIFAHLPIEVTALDALPAPIAEPDEDAPTFEGNAEKKAVHYARASGRVCLADDSGLEVDALGGSPGVHSARYAGTGSTRPERDAANNAKLLRELAGVPAAARTARFVCAMCMAAPDGRVVAQSRGTFEGVIGREPRGSNGFGYDPLLVLADGRTSAELSPAEKNSRSHRGVAARDIARALVDLRGSRDIRRRGRTAT